MREPRAILITGASSGIGAALAAAYAAPGVHLFLGGRNAARLEQIAATCRDKGADAETADHDVTDREAMAGWVARCDDGQALDLVIANAGISGGTGGGGESAELARRIFAVNVDGVLNTVLPALPRLAARGRGQLAIVSSLASFYGFSGAPAYSASKAAVRMWGEALAVAHRHEGIEISVVCPGFIATPMTAVNDYAMPMMMSAERAAAIIHRGLARGSARIAFPLPMYWLSWLAGAMPLWLTRPVNARLPKKT